MAALPYEVNSSVIVGKTTGRVTLAITGIIEVVTIESLNTGIPVTRDTMVVGNSVIIEDSADTTTGLRIGDISIIEDMTYTGILVTTNIPGWDVMVSRIEVRTDITDMAAGNLVITETSDRDIVISHIEALSIIMVTQDIIVSEITDTLGRTMVASLIVRSSVEATIWVTVITLGHLDSSRHAIRDLDDTAYLTPDWSAARCLKEWIPTMTERSRRMTS